MRRRKRNLQERCSGPTVRRSFVERAEPAAGTGEKLEWSPEAHVISNLCMLSPDSRNNRTYLPSAMADLQRLYEGARAYQDHPLDPTEHRSTKDRIGRWHNVRIEDGKLRGDLHYDPNHPYARSLIWAAQNAPDHCGVSHNVEAEGYEDADGHFTVNRVNEVRSVDIVDDPATNKSLLESTQPRRQRRKLREGAMDPDMDDDKMTPEHHLGKYMMACLEDPDMDEDEVMTRMKDAVKHYRRPSAEVEEEEDELDVEHDPEDERGKPRAQEPERDEPHIATEEEEEEEEEDAMMARESGSDEILGKNKAGQIRAMWHKDPENPYSESFQARESLQRLRKHKDKKVRAVVEIALRALPKPRRRQSATESLARHSDPAVRAMAKRLDALEAEKSAVESVQRAIAECKQYRLPKRVMSKMFIEDLAECTDAKRRKQMIMERAHLASISIPRSFGPGGIGGGPPKISNEQFAHMIHGYQD